MFIGEMGCWLVIAGFAAYQRFVSSRKSAPLLAGGGHGGYTALNTHDTDAEGHSDGEDEDRVREEDLERMGASFSSLDPHNPTVKSMLPHVAVDEHGRIPLRGWRVALLAMPACCDIIGTTFMNAGLLFVAASIYQMTRGALVLFVGLFSVLFLKRRLALYQWSALFVVVLGVAVVGLAGAIEPNPQHQPGDPDPNPASRLRSLALLARTVYVHVKRTAVSDDALLTVAGVLMIALAQIFTATQFVLEEYILEHYELEPLKVVGWEGVFGFIVTVLAMLVLHAAVGRTPKGRGGYFDAAEGWRQVVSDRVVAVTSLLIMISIGGFNFFGLSVTRSVSATARSTIDTCRTLFIWIVSLGLGWETFKWLQIVGFVLLVYGTFLFNDLVRPPLKACLWGGGGVNSSDEDPKRGRQDSSLLQEEPIEHS